jgi:hypothetical protein
MLGLLLVMIVSVWSSHSDSMSRRACVLNRRSRSRQIRSMLPLPLVGPPASHLLKGEGVGGFR